MLDATMTQQLKTFGTANMSLDNDFINYRG